MSKEKELIDYTFDPESVAGDVINSILNDASGAVYVNGKNRRPLFDRITGEVISGLENAVEIVETQGIYYTLGTADVYAYYFNEKLYDANPTAASNIAVGVFNNYGTNMDLTFARGAAATKIYAYGQDVTLLDTTAIEVFASGQNQYNFLNPSAIQGVTGDSTISVVNSNVNAIYAGGEGEDIYQGDVVVNIANSTVGAIYAGGKAGAYTKGDLTVVVSNAGNQFALGSKSVFRGTVFGFAPDAISNTWGKTSVVVDNYNGSYLGGFRYVDTVLVNGDSDVTFMGAFYEVGTVAVAGAARATVYNVGAYDYELILTSDTLANSAAAMLTLSGRVAAVDKVVVTINDDYVNNGAVNLLSWPGYNAVGAVVPTFSVMNENGGYDGNGGIVADYMYSYNFDAKNNLTFTYDDKAYVLTAGKAVPAFGAADDKVIVSGTYNHAAAQMDFGAGANEIDITNANAANAFDLIVDDNNAKNTVIANGFTNDVNFIDKGGKNTKAVAVVDGAVNVDFKGSKEATLVVEGTYTGNADFSSVADEAAVVLENGASMGLGQITAGAKDVKVVVEAFNTATLNGLTAANYVLQKDDDNFVDVDLELGNNAVLISGGTNIVKDYSKNISTAAAVTYDVLGNMSSDVIVNAGHTFTVNNYGVVSGYVALDAESASFALTNYGEFNGTFDAAALNNNQNITNTTKENSDLGAAELGGNLLLGGGVDVINSTGDAEISANITKYAAAGSTLTINANNGYTVFSGSIGYTMDGIYDDDRIDADDAAIALGIAGTSVSIANGTFEVAEGSELYVGTVTINNAIVKGAFDANNVNVNGNAVFENDEEFSGNLTVAVGTTLKAQNLTVAGAVNVNGTLDAKAVEAATVTSVAGATIDADSLTATGGDVNLAGTTIGDTVISAVNVVVTGNADLGDITATGNVAIGTGGATTAITAGDIIGKDISINSAEAGDAVTTGKLDASGNITLVGAGAVTVGAVEADGTLDVTVADVTFAETVDVDDFALKTANQKLTFKKEASFGDITANANAEINAEAEFTMDSLAVAAGVTLDINADGQTVTATSGATIANGSTIDIDGAEFVGGITEVIDGATVILRNDASVDKITFIGSNIQVENAAEIEELKFVANLNIAGVPALENDGVDTLTIGNGIKIADDDATTKNVTITGAVVEGDIDLINDLATGTLTTTGNVTLDNVEAVVTAQGTAAEDTLTMDSLKGSVTFGGTEALEKIVISGDADGIVNANATDLEIGNWVAGAVVSGKEVAITAQEDAITTQIIATGDLTVDAAEGAAYDVTAATITAANVTLNDANAVSGTVTATQDVKITAAGAVDATVTAANATIDAASVAGNITATDADPLDDIADGNVDITADGLVNVNVNAVEVEIDAADVNGSIVASGDAVVKANVDAYIRGANVEVNGETVDGTLFATAGTVKVTGADDVAADITAANGAIVVEDASVVSGNLSALNSTIDLGDAVVEGDVTITTGALAGDFEYSFNFAENYAGTVTATANGASSITFNFTGDDFYAVTGTGNVTVNYDVENTYVAFDEATGDITAATKAINNGINVDISGEYIGNITGVPRAGSVTVAGNYFGSYVGGTLNKGQVYAADFTVAGDYSETTQNAIDAFFADAKLTADPTETHSKTNEISDIISAKYADGLVYADVNVTNSFNTDKLFVGTVTGGKEIKFGADATVAFDTVTEVAPGAGMDAAVATDPAAPAVLVNAVNASVDADGDVYGNKTYFANQDFVDGDLARSDVQIINGAAITAKNVDVAGNFFGNINATGDVVLHGDIVGGRKIVDGNSEITDYPVVTDYTANIIAGSFENTNAGAVVKANITATAADEIDPETLEIVDVALKAVAKVDGNVTATAGSVDVAEVTGTVQAAVNATVAGNAASVTATAGYADITGNVTGAVAAGTYVELEGNAASVNATAGYADITGDVTGAVVAGTYVELEGTAASVNAGTEYADITGDVTGAVVAGTYVELEGTAASVNAGTYADITGSVTGDVTAGTYVELDGEGTVAASVTAGTYANITGDVTYDVSALNGDAYVDGNVGGQISATGDVTALGTVGGAVTAGGTATLGGNVAGVVTADTVTATGDITEINSDVNANTVELADVTVTGNVIVGQDIVYGANDVTVGAITGDFEYYGDSDATVTVGDITGSAIVIKNGQDPAYHAPSINITATFGDVDVDTIEFTGLTYTYEAGEEEERIVTSNIDFTAETIETNAITINGGVVAFTADFIAREFSDVDKSATGINLTGNGELLLNARTYVNAVTGTLDLTIGKDLSNAVDANGDIIATKADVAVNSFTANSANIMGINLTAAVEVNVDSASAFYESTVVAPVINFDAAEVALSDYFKVGSTFTVDKLVADTLIVDQALNLTKALEVTGNFTVAEGAAITTAQAITLSGDDVVVNISEGFSYGIVIENDATIEKIVGTSVSGTTNANNIVLEGEFQENTFGQIALSSQHDTLTFNSVVLSSGTISLGYGNDTFEINADATLGNIDGGSVADENDNKDTLAINADVTAGTITGIDNFVFGAEGSLTATWEITADTNVSFAQAGEGTIGVTVSGLTTDNFILVGEDKWTWDGTAFVNGEDKLVYDAVKEELTWTLA